MASELPFLLAQVEDTPEPVYANIERQPPGTLPGVTVAPRPSQVWETHTDAGTGRLYYYNPDTGVTTWESPFEAAEGTASPTTSRASVGSRGSLETDWGQYWDEESRRVFFYNPLTGDTVWEDEPEHQPEDEDEMEMQLGLSPGSPRDQRVRGGAWAGVGEAGFEDPRPTLCSLHPPTLGEGSG